MGLETTSRPASPRREVLRGLTQMNPSAHKLLEQVGYGGSAAVYRTIYLAFNNVVAVKFLDLDRCDSNLDDTRTEAQTMSLIDHPNVVRAYCSFVVGRNLWVVMPFMAEASCLQLIKMAYPDGYEDAAITSIPKETLKALEYLHRQGYIHRDVMAVVKLADFGVSASMFDKVGRQLSRNSFVGTPRWSYILLMDFSVSLIDVFAILTYLCIPRWH